VDKSVGNLVTCYFTEKNSELPDILSRRNITQNQHLQQEINISARYSAGAVN